MGSIITIPIVAVISLITDFNYYLKWVTSYTCARIEEKRSKKRFDLYDEFAENDPVKVNFIPAPEEYVLESPAQETDLLTASDEVFFYGVNSKSECLIVRIARCPDGEAEAWIHLKLCDGRAFQLRETSGYQQSSCSRKAFTCGGLQMHFISPMRRWRLFFNGLLKQVAETDETAEKLVQVKFSLIWYASSDAFDFTTDIPRSSLAKGVANASWPGYTPPLQNLRSALNAYAQSGTINGQVSIEGGTEDREIYLFGEKVRFLGDMSAVKSAEFYHSLSHIPKDGSFVHICQVTIPNTAENLMFGFTVQPSGEIHKINCSEMLSKVSIIKEHEEREFGGRFQVEGEVFNLKSNTSSKRILFHNEERSNGFVTIGKSEIFINSFKCDEITIKKKIFKPLERKAEYRNLEFFSKSGENSFVVHFSENICQDSSLTGGKGSSLGVLTEFSKHLKNFVVPKGVVVTTSAYERFITKDVLKEITRLENVLYGNISGDVKEACEKVMQAIIGLEFPPMITKAIESVLREAFPNIDSTKVAVRSSATGEDTEQMSAAGQMETYLGVLGLREILLAVKKCWASQFSYIAVQYKRQNGQVINSPMAVVIQEMVPCDVAGVLFTCDPLTGNPTLMSITANYGLGESVVSGSEEPDTIELQRDTEENIIIKSKHIGGKSRCIILTDDSDGTDTKTVSEEERNTCCLSDEMIHRLGYLAMKLEKKYRSCRDIEWGFYKNILYVFQSRPVTSGTEETLFELEHEFDAPLRAENDYFTVCNVGEVMPGAFSPLGLEICLKYFAIGFNTVTNGAWLSFKPRYFLRGFVSMYSHAMFYCCDLLSYADKSEDIHNANMVALFGRVIDDDEMFEVASYRFKNAHKSWISGFIENCYVFLRLFTNKRRLDKTAKSYEAYRIPFEKCATSKELFQVLLRACTQLIKPFMTHMDTTDASAIWNMFILNMLIKARGEINTDVYQDFAKLLTTNSAVESADVPSAIANLASHIEKEIKPEEFKKMETKDILEWLGHSSTAAALKYQEFIKRHGHRCLKEFDLHSKPWGRDPSTLVQLLKNLVGNASKNIADKKENNCDKLISDLGLSFSFIKRYLLKYLIHKCHQSVQNREASKSLLIKSQNEWRKGYYHLAKLMVSEGRIPDSDLLFFMTLEEIQELLETRSPKVISRASRRRKHHPTLDKYIFPEIMKGFPKPVNIDLDTPVIPSEENFSMKGIPVSQGVVKAYVRVALTLDEAAQLQPGEILLTYSTDIGWSPYFPILAGVVTELGGLISHGAVVSREYGLPCIAGLHGVTRQFVTGDYVLLDGNRGILQKLSKPEL